jgi:hypothetical protein
MPQLEIFRQISDALAVTRETRSIILCALGQLMFRIVSTIDTKGGATWSDRRESIWPTTAEQGQ